MASNHLCLECKYSKHMKGSENMPTKEGSKCKTCGKRMSRFDLGEHERTQHRVVA